MITKQQQNELDTIEKQILIALFGQDTIPDSTGLLFNIFGINPNKMIKEFEELICPIMNDDGSVSGNFLKKIISISPKYRDILSFVKIPDGDFLVSNIIFEIISVFIPGVIQ